MHRPFRLAFVFAGVVALVVAAACNGAGPSSDESFAADGGTTATGSGGETPPATDAGTATASATMRIAHLAPGVGPIDFCYQAARAGTFLGPVLGGSGASADAGADAEAGDARADDAAAPPATAAPDASEPARSAPYRTVSKYVNVAAAGPLRIAVVAAGAASCANALAVLEATLDPGKLSTIALFSHPGDGGAVLELGAFTDDRTPAAAAARVRVINAALGSDGVRAAPAIAVRAAGSTALVLADRVEPKKAASESPAALVDALGYVTAPPLDAPASIAIGLASTDAGIDAGYVFEPWQSGSADLDLTASSIHTAFVLTGTSADRFEVEWCADTMTSGDRTSCILLEQRAK